MYPNLTVEYKNIEKEQNKELFFESETITVENILSKVCIQIVNVSRCKSTKHLHLC